MKKIINFFSSIFLITFNRPDTSDLVQASVTATNIPALKVEIKDSVNIIPNGKSPKWSPDGSKIVYKVHKNFTVELWIYEIEKALSYAIVKNIEGNLSSTWSPDSKKIAFDAYESSTSRRHQIWIKDLDKGELYLFTKYNSGCTSPGWSNDGTQIVFENNNYLKTKNLNTSALKKINNTKGASNPAWNHDDSELVFTVKEGEKSKICLMDLLSSIYKSITTHDGESNKANFSSDGNYISYQTMVEDKFSIYVYCRKTAKTHLITSLNSGGNPSWSPEGHQMVLEENGGIKILILNLIT